MQRPSGRVGEIKVGAVGAALDRRAVVDLGLGSGGGDGRHHGVKVPRPSRSCWRQTTSANSSPATCCSPTWTAEAASQQDDFVAGCPTERPPDAHDGTAAAVGRAIRTSHAATRPSAPSRTSTAVHRRSTVGSILAVAINRTAVCHQIRRRSLARVVVARLRTPLDANGAFLFIAPRGCPVRSVHCGASCRSGYQRRQLVPGAPHMISRYWRRSMSISAKCARKNP
jgi:hypothetical protein